MIDYSIVVPVYGAENSLEKLHESLRAFFEGRYSYEIIYVDDASADNSWEVLKKIKTTAANVKAIRLSKNFGQHPATMCGFKYAQGSFIITIDDDLEVHPSQIQHLIDEQKKTNDDVVYGVYGKLNISFTRKLLTGTYKLLAKIEGKEKGKGSSFRLIKKNLVNKLVANHSRFVFIDELCLWYTKKLKFCNVEPNKDFIHKARYRVSDLLSMSGTVILFSSTLPLKLITQAGMALSVVNFIIGIYFMIKKFFFKTDVEGFTSLIVSILFSTGIIILCLGILAQYLNQAIKGINHAPAYNEDEILC